jgi:hypothetical protein
MSGGQGACKAVMEARKTGDTTMADVANNFTPGKIISGFGAKNDSDQAIISVLNNNLKNINQTIIDNKCGNLTTVKQTNEYISNPICYQAKLDFCKGEKDRVACYAELTKKESENINQTNLNKTSTECVLNSIIEVLSKQEANIKNLATLESTQSAKGLMSENKGKQTNCNEINNNITSENYIEQMLKCHNETVIEQKNIINDCSPTVSSQLNNNDSLQKCMIKQGLFMKTDLSGAIDSATKGGLDQTATGLTLTEIIFIIIAVVVGVALIGFLINYFKNRQRLNIVNQNS